MEDAGLLEPQTNPRPLKHMATVLRNVCLTKAGRAKAELLQISWVWHRWLGKGPLRLETERRKP